MTAKRYFFFGRLNASPGDPIWKDQEIDFILVEPRHNMHVAQIEEMDRLIASLFLPQSVPTPTAGVQAGGGDGEGTAPATDVRLPLTT